MNLVRISLIFAILLALAAPAFGQDNRNRVNYKIRVHVDANLRSQPDINSARVGAVLAGTELDVTEERENWLKVWTGAGSGWMAGWLSYTRIDPTPSVPINTPKTTLLTYFDLLPECDASTFAIYSESLLPSLGTTINSMDIDGSAIVRRAITYLSRHLPLAMDGSLKIPPCRQALHLFHLYEQATHQWMLALAYSYYNNSTLANPFFGYFNVTLEQIALLTDRQFGAP